MPILGIDGEKCITCDECVKECPAFFTPCVVLLAIHHDFPRVLGFGQVRRPRDGVALEVEVLEDDESAQTQPQQKGAIPPVVGHLNVTIGLTGISSSSPNET